jgi:signal transduction histidine kinase
LIFLVLLTTTLLLTSAFAIFVAARIARPITELTAFTRRFARDSKLSPPSSVRGEVGELAGAFVTMVHDLDRSRENFLRASRLAVAGEFAAAIAHEIRTPLGILKSSAQVLRQEAGISAEGRELVGYVESETERINRLVSGLLESANPRPPVFAPHDVSNIVHACTVMLMPQAAQKKIRIEQNDVTGNLVIDCDVEQLIQVLLNLLLNALQLLPENGRIGIDCSDQGSRVRIDVSDDGPGIPTTDRAHIFEPFFSKRRGGLGLGLSVVQQIVSAHRGQIQVGTSRWGGALFSILLPRSASE